MRREEGLRSTKAKQEADLSPPNSQPRSLSSLEEESQLHSIALTSANSSNLL